LYLLFREYLLIYLLPLLEVHSFVYEALLSLVLVHAQISDIAKPLINRALTALLESMAIDCLEAFQRVEKFSLGGMCQVR
jgi:exocyst complex component 2